MTEYTETDISDIVGVSRAVVNKWIERGQIKANKKGFYDFDELSKFEPFRKIYSGYSTCEAQKYLTKVYNSVELFSGAGGLALGLEQAGFRNLLINDFDKDCCRTLGGNRPDWNVVHKNILDLDFNNINDQVDLLSGGFPCQPFSYAGNKKGFQDERGTLFFQFCRALDTLKPKAFLIENVKGLVSHNAGRTLSRMILELENLGYQDISYKVLKAILYEVPQKRERLFIVGFRESSNFCWPKPMRNLVKLREALMDVPFSAGYRYSKRKEEILSCVPQGGNWRDLPLDLQKEYMQKSFYLSGGKTGIARRMAWDQPSLTLTCSPGQKQTERCHPEETRPFTIREYARIQTFPDAWQFKGSLSSQYKQIGNAVPVRLAYHLGLQLKQAIVEEV